MQSYFFKGIAYAQNALKNFIPNNTQEFGLKKTNSAKRFLTNRYKLPFAEFVSVSKSIFVEAFSSKQQECELYFFRSSSINISTNNFTF